MRLRLTFVLAFSLAFAVTGLGQKRNITEKDLFNFNWIGDPQVAPDGSRVAFVKVTVNEKKDGYNTSIWIVSTATGEAKQLTSGMRDSSPRWSPDGNYLAFVRVPEKDGRPDQPQLFMLSMEGGEAFQFTFLPRGAGNPQWSPDGKMIAFANGATPEELAKAMPRSNTAASASPTPVPERDSDVRVITRAVYRSNDAGYLDYKHPSHIWVVTAPRTGDQKVTPKQLTSGRYSDGNVTWGKDSATIYFVSDHRDESYYELGKTDIYSIPVAGGQPTLLTSIDMGTGAFSVSPNGKQVAFFASSNTPVLSYTQPDLWVMDLAPNAQPRSLTLNRPRDLS